MKKIKIIIVAVLMIIILILLPAILNLFTKDIGPIDDSDLRLSAEKVNDEDNAYFDLIKISDVIYASEGSDAEVLKMVNNKTWNQALADEIVSKNKEAFELFSNAAKKPKYQNPSAVKPENIKYDMALPPLNEWRKLSNYSVIKALDLSKKGRSGEAIEEALNSAYIGQKIQESQVLTIEYLIAIVLKENGLETVQEIVKTSDLPNDELMDYSKKIDIFYNNEKGMISVIKGEYQAQAGIVDSFTKKEMDKTVSLVGEKEVDKYSLLLKNSYYFRPNKTRLMFADYARAEIENIDKFCKDIKKDNIQRRSSDSLITSYITENVIGNMFYDITVIGLSGINAKKCNDDSLVSVTKALIAIRAYRNDNGDYPDSLDNLVPRYLESLPLDYFDGQPLKYSKEKKIIYFIGKNLADNGGSTGEDWKEMEDPTFKISY